MFSDAILEGFSYWGVEALEPGELDVYASSLVGAVRFQRALEAHQWEPGLPHYEARTRWTPEVCEIDEFQYREFGFVYGGEYSLVEDVVKEYGRCRDGCSYELTVLEEGEVVTFLVARV